ncbi:MAG: hypothetical protein LAP40_25885 [Acidobacteriia bacterium]|nr:hypothetical protein [Terriglobia bacterium]
MRLFSAVVGLWFCTQSLAAQPALVQSDVARAATCLGNAEVTVTPVAPAPDLVIAVFSETLRDEDPAQLRKEIATVYQSARQMNSMRLALVAGNNVQFAGPFKTRALLQSALAEIMPAAPDAAPPVAPARFYNVLGTVASQLGMDWSAVVLAGQFPAVPPEQAAFTEGWLSMKLRAAKLRVSYWTPAGAASDFLDQVTLSTGGVHLADGLEPLAAMLRQKAEFREVSWPAPVPAWSFRACSVSLVAFESDATRFSCAVLWRVV